MWILICWNLINNKSLNSFKVSHSKFHLFRRRSESFTTVINFYEPSFDHLYDIWWLFHRHIIRCISIQTFFNDGDTKYCVILKGLFSGLDLWIRKSVGLTDLKLWTNFIFQKHRHGTKGQGHRGLNIVSNERSCLRERLCKI